MLALFIVLSCLFKPDSVPSVQCYTMFSPKNMKVNWSGYWIILTLSTQSGLGVELQANIQTACRNCLNGNMHQDYLCLRCQPRDTGIQLCKWFVLFAYVMKNCSKGGIVYRKCICTYRGGSDSGGRPSLGDTMLQSVWFKTGNVSCSFKLRHRGFSLN